MAGRGNSVPGAAPRNASTPVFVLVHGAFHGGWCWRLVAEALRASGYPVFTPTFTGLGERQHLLNADVDLGLWVTDVVAVIDSEELENIILVGHSFGGHVISGVADRRREKIRQLVFLDGGPATSGVPVSSSMPRDVWDARMKGAFERSGVMCFPNPPAAYFGVNDVALARWLDRRLTPMPVRAYTTSLTLLRPAGEGVPTSFIHCTRPALEIATKAAAHARSMGWDYWELPTGHDAMVTAPEALVSIMLSRLRLPWRSFFPKGISNPLP